MIVRNKYKISHPLLLGDVIIKARSENKAKKIFKKMVINQYYGDNSLCSVFVDEIINEMECKKV